MECLEVNTAGQQRSGEHAQGHASTPAGVGRRVPTRAIQAAVKGRESAVLDTLKIAWRKGQPHLRCPYPEHADGDPSWRWHARKARAYCTCISGSHSIFDVVMRIEGLGFEAAKLRVAEILGRTDLVREVAAGPHHQATDAASLLRPPPERRDDGLPIAYLACRLKVAVEQVPRPTTPMTGFKALASCDPPVRPGGRPKPVGHYPCAVFGTLAAGGRLQRLHLPCGPRCLTDPVGKLSDRRPHKMQQLQGKEHPRSLCLPTGTVATLLRHLPSTFRSLSPRSASPDCALPCSSSR